MKVLMIVNDTNFAWNLRREILFSFVENGWDTSLIAQTLNYKSEFEKSGVKILDLNIHRRGTNPFEDFRLFLGYIRILKTEKPDLVFINNTKPNIYAGLACQLLNIKYISNVTGLGTAVEIPGKLQRLSIFLYKMGVKKATTLLFQNRENLLFFENHKMIAKNTNYILLPGSGVNLESHPVLPWNESQIHFLFVARIMKEKGIDLFLSIANKYASPGVIFDVCGQCDDPQYLEKLENNSNVVYHGLQSDLVPFYEECSCFLYPSYYPEGMSNVCLEAAACGRPLIVADRAGCRETVVDGVTGFVVPIKDEPALEGAVEKILHMSIEQRREMGLAGRKKMEQDFDRRNIISIYINEVKKQEMINYKQYR